VINSQATSVTSLTLHLSAIVAGFVFWREICHPAFLDFCNKIGTQLSRSNGAACPQLAKADAQLFQFSSTPFRSPNLYNQRPQWLADAHCDLDAAVAAAYGWPADVERIT
jgi:hypothetical protein